MNQFENGKNEYLIYEKFSYHIILLRPQLLHFVDSYLTISNIQQTHLRRLKIDEDGKEDIPTPDFITNKFRGFFPAMVNSIDNIKVGGEKELPEEDINILFKKMLGGLLKMIYAILWQVLLLI